MRNFFISSLLVVSLTGCGDGPQSAPAPPAEPTAALPALEITADSYGLVPVLSIGTFIDAIGLVVRAEKVADINSLPVGERFGATVFRIDCPDPSTIGSGPIPLGVPGAVCALYPMNGRASTSAWVTAGSVSFDNIDSAKVSGSFDVQWGYRTPGVEPAEILGPLERFAGRFETINGAYAPL